MPPAGLLTCPAQGVHVGWPGFGGVAPDQAIRNIAEVACPFASQVAPPIGGHLAAR